MQSSYQDRLGTNIGKALKIDLCVFLQTRASPPSRTRLRRRTRSGLSHDKRRKTSLRGRLRRAGRCDKWAFFLLSSSVAEMKTGNRLPTQARDKYVRTDSVEKQRAFSSSFLHRYLSVLPVACRHQRTIRLAGRRMRRTGRVRETPLFGAFLY